MYPHERSLVAKMAGRPFVLLGVNTDPDLAKTKARVAEEKLTWRSFWDGPYGTNGPISGAWDIHSYPTLFVIDHAGVIRAKDVRGEKALDALLEKLVTEAEAAK